MVRALPCQGRGREFKSRSHRHARLAQRKSTCPTCGRPEGQHLQRVPSSHGETEIMADYEFVVGGSSPPGSANGKAPRASVAEWTIAPGCKPGPTGTVVRIHPGAPSFHGPVDRTPVSGTGDRRFESCWKRSGLIVQGTAWLPPKKQADVRIVLSPRMARVSLVVGGGLPSRQ